MEDKELELQRWQDIILNHLDSQMELDELTDFMDSNVILVEGQKKMLERMIYPSDSNPYLQHIDWTFGREPIQTIIDNGYYGIEDKEMLNNLREHWVQHRRRRS